MFLIFEMLSSAKKIIWGPKRNLFMSEIMLSTFLSGKQEKK